MKKGILLVSVLVLFVFVFSTVGLAASEIKVHDFNITEVDGGVEVYAKAEQLTNGSRYYIHEMKFVGFLDGIKTDNKIKSCYSDVCEITKQFLHGDGDYEIRLRIMPQPEWQYEYHASRFLTVTTNDTEEQPPEPPSNETEESCIDSDDDNIYNKGTVTIGTRTYEDYCDGRWVHEYQCGKCPFSLTKFKYCDPVFNVDITYVSNYTLRCGDAVDSCVNGACVKESPEEPPTTECTDDLDCDTGYECVSGDCVEKSVCPTIDITGTQNSYKVGDNLDFKVYIYDSNGDAISNQKFNLTLEKIETGSSGMFVAKMYGKEALEQFSNKEGFLQPLVTMFYAIFAGTLEESTETTFETDSTGVFTFSEEIEDVDTANYKITVSVEEEGCYDIEDSAVFEIVEEVTTSEVLSIGIKLESMRVLLIGYKNQAVKIKDFYADNNMTADEERFEQIIGLFNDATDLIDETKTLIKDNSDDPTSVITQVRANLVKLKEIIFDIIELLLTVSTDAEVVNLYTSEQGLHFGDRLGTVVKTITETDMKTLLASRNHIDASGTQTLYEQYIKLDLANKVTGGSFEFGRPTTTDEPTPYIKMPAGASISRTVYTYSTLTEFSGGININNTDVQGTEIELFGTTYTIGSESTTATSTPKLVLYGSGQKRLVLEHSKKARAGPDETDINGTYVRLTFNEPNSLSKVSVFVGADKSSENFIKPNGEFTDPVWGTFKVVFGDLNNPWLSDQAEEIEFRAMTSMVEVIYNDATSGTETYLYFAKDPNTPSDTGGLLLAGTDGSYSVAEGAPAELNDYIITDAGGNGHVWQVTDIDQSGYCFTGDGIELTDVLTGSTIQFEYEAGSCDSDSKIIDRKTFYIKNLDNDTIALTWEADLTDTGVGVEEPGRFITVWPGLTTTGGAKIYLTKAETTSEHLTIFGNSSSGGVTENINLQMPTGILTLNIINQSGGWDLLVTQPGNSSPYIYASDLESLRVDYITINVSSQEYAMFINFDVETKYTATAKFKFSLYNSDVKAIDEPAALIKEELSDKGFYETIIIRTADNANGATVMEKPIFSSERGNAWKSVGAVLPTNSQYKYYVDRWGSKVLVDSSTGTQGRTLIYYPFSQLGFDAYISTT